MGHEETVFANICLFCWNYKMPSLLLLSSLGARCQFTKQRRRKVMLKIVSFDCNQRRFFWIFISMKEKKWIQTFLYLSPWWANCHGGLVAITDGGPWCYMVGHHWHILPSCRFSLFSIEKVSVKKFSFCFQISLKLWDKIHGRDNAGKCKIILNFSASCRIIHRAALAATNPMKPPQWHIVSIIHFIVIVIVL